MTSLTAMETSSTEFEPTTGFWRCLDTAGQVDLKLPAFLHTIGHFGVRVGEARMWVEELLRQGQTSWSKPHGSPPVPVLSGRWNREPRPLRFLVAEKGARLASLALASSSSV